LECVGDFRFEIKEEEVEIWWIAKTLPNCQIWVFERCSVVDSNILFGCWILPGISGKASPLIQESDAWKRQGGWAKRNSSINAFGHDQNYARDDIPDFSTYWMSHSRSSILTGRLWPGLAHCPYWFLYPFTQLLWYVTFPLTISLYSK
jgi:hypothetical protein